MSAKRKAPNRPAKTIRKPARKVVKPTAKERELKRAVVRHLKDARAKFQKAERQINAHVKQNPKKAAAIAEAMAKAITDSVLSHSRSK